MKVLVIIHGLCFDHVSHSITTLYLPSTTKYGNTYLVSDPTHPRYGQHLSEDDVNQLIKPTNTAIDQIHEWLLYNNISQDRLKYSPARDWINIEVPVSIAEKLLDTSFSVFRHKDGSQFVRTTQWSLPAHLHGHVQTIQPTTSFFRPRSEISILKSNHNEDIFNLLQLTTVASPNTTSATNSCNATAVTSLCLRTLYGKILRTYQSFRTDTMQAVLTTMFNLVEITLSD